MGLLIKIKWFSKIHLFNTDDGYLNIHLDKFNWKIKHATADLPFSETTSNNQPQLISNGRLTKE